jgi:hypothetical protein
MEVALVSYPVARERVPVATHVRTTVLMGSQASLRMRGHFDRYAALLSPEYRSLLSPMGPAWLPIAHAVAHYDACRRLELSTAELLSIGRDVESRLQGTFLSTATKLATAAGVTPWTILSRMDEAWGRMFRGSAIACFKVGPKEGRVEIAGWPFAQNPYNRASFRGILAGFVNPFCGTVYVRDATDPREERVGAWKVSWA